MVKHRGILFFLKKSILFVLDILNLKKKLFNKYSYKKLKITKAIQQEISDFQIKPLISIIIQSNNLDIKTLTRTLCSLREQWYDIFNVIFLTNNMSNHERGLISLKFKTLDIIFIDNNSKSLNLIDCLKGTYFSVLRDGDELTNNSLYEMVKVINQSESDLIYSDNDLVTEQGKYYRPFYKGNYNGEMLLSYNYIRSLFLIKKSIVNELLMDNNYEINEYSLLLSTSCNEDNIHYIASILFHEYDLNYNNKKNNLEISKAELKKHLAKNHIDAKICSGILSDTFRIKRKIVANALVSIIIPFKDQPELLKTCISSILEKSTYQNYEIIAVNNNSTKAETFELINKLDKIDSRINFVTYNIPFNYSAINNYAVSLAKGKHLILLNNDIEIISDNWVESLLEYSQLPEVGAVGGLLFYPDHSIQHDGVFVGFGDVAGHYVKNNIYKNDKMHKRPYISQYVSAVTAACLMIKTELFNELGGLNETDLAIAFNDVDFCLRIREKGYLNVYTPYCQAYHHESISRGPEDTAEKMQRFENEINYMKHRHSRVINEDDPYYHIKLIG